MEPLTPDLLSRACRVFLAHAYPQGVHAVPANRSAFLELNLRAPLDAVLKPPICQTLTTDGRLRGYALRLGSADYPHLKLQVVNCDHSDTWVFAVDTHDTIRLSPDHPDTALYARLQAKNRVLKEDIERAWESAGLLTFNALLRRGLNRERCLETHPVSSQPGTP